MKLSEIRRIAKNQQEALMVRDSGYDRELLAELPDIKSHALIISGIRRCGKSTLLHQFVKKTGRPFFYFNFEDLRLVGFANADYGLLDTALAESAAKLLFLMKCSRQNTGNCMSAKNWIKAFGRFLPGPTPLF
jgi:predicted AAA+ superfamily ATPase